MCFTTTQCAEFNKPLIGIRKFRIECNYIIKIKLQKNSVTYYTYTTLTTSTYIFLKVILNFGLRFILQLDIDKSKDMRLLK